MFPLVFAAISDWQGTFCPPELVTKERAPFPMAMTSLKLKTRKR
jgi:hypothetical protein